MNGLNLSEVSDIRLGSNTINAIYYGSTLLWPLVPRDYSKEYLTIKAVSDATVVFYKTSDEISRTIQYSKNKRTWETISFGNFSDKDIPEAYKVSLLAGEKLYLKGSNSAYGDERGNYCSININEGSGNISGNIMSLIYGDNFYGQTVLDTPYSFHRLFASIRIGVMYEYNNIIDASNLILPATTLADNCYFFMFESCISLTTAPELPATTLADGCYFGMFDNCESLTTAPELHATTLADGCYSQMFQYCTSLTTAPELPATTLSNRCYSEMFYYCRSLKTAPELPATTLSNSCYSEMFYYCDELTSAPELPATTLAIGCYSYMFKYCTSLTTAPELPATTLSNSCYFEMFDNCTSLNYIKCLATDISAIDCLSGWVYGVASTGTFVKNPNMSNWTTGESGIPLGWTVKDA